MRNKAIFILALLGILVGLLAAYIFTQKRPHQPPVFSPAPNPFVNGIYANGIIESFQRNGENVNIFPEVPGTVLEIKVSEGQIVEKGDELLKVDDSVQRATVEQLRSQAESARAVLDQLKAQPRKETLDVSKAQVEANRANLKSVQDQLAKVIKSYQLNPKSVSPANLDNAKNAVKIAEMNLLVAVRQFELTKAGAWKYDIESQQRVYEALLKQAAAAEALLGKYTIRAVSSGVILSINTSVGSYVSTQGAFGTYTQNLNPMIVMGASGEGESGTQRVLQVRSYVDEILVHRLPDPSRIEAKMFIRGTNVNIPLQFLRVQPYVIPKIELSSQRQELVDVRVLPVIFKFDKPANVKLYPGQLVDIYIGEKGQPGRISKGN